MASRARKLLTTWLFLATRSSGMGVSSRMKEANRLAPRVVSKRLFQSKNEDEVSLGMEDQLLDSTGLELLIDDDMMRSSSSDRF